MREPAVALAASTFSDGALGNFSAFSPSLTKVSKSLLPSLSIFE
jgi:hypothetical protein